MTKPWDSEGAKRTARMRDSEAWICPHWCLQPDEEDGEHIGDWSVFSTLVGHQFFMRLTVPWDRQGVGGPRAIGFSSAGGTTTVDEDVLRSLLDEYERLDGLADDWHVYEYPTTDHNHYAEAWPGAWDEYRAADEDAA